MIKNQMLSTIANTEMAMAVVGETLLSFAFGRQRVIRLAPLDSSMEPGYVWKRVFLKGRRHP